MIPAEATCPRPRIAATAPPEARIRQLLDEKDRALCEKDLEGILAHYDTDLVFFDLKPSVRVEGSRGLRRVWQACMPHLPTVFHIEARDLVITVAGELAVAHRLFRVPEVARAESGWIREIVVLRYAQGEWRIVHEHCSVA
jgi:ketosteroid isomerase-like protein